MVIILILPIATSSFRLLPSLARCEGRLVSKHGVLAKIFYHWFRMVLRQLTVGESCLMGADHEQG